MKKFLTFIIVLCMAFSCAMFTACTHTHSYATEWSSDATNHWHACTGKDCTATSDLGAHTYANGVCSVCGYAEPATYEVTQTEWNAAFATGNEITQINTTTYENGMSTIQTYKYKAGVGISQVQENIMNDEVVYSAGYYFEIDSVNDKVYSYQPIFDQDGQTVLGYSKEETYVDFSQMDEYLLPSELMDMSAYTYNATTKAYEAASIAITDGPTFTNLSVKFKNGELVSFTDSSEGGSMGASTTVLTISRDPVTITFPSAMKTTVTAQEFNYALNLVQRDATVTTTLGSGSTGVMKLDKEGRIHVVQPNREFYVENVVEGSSSKIYMYTKIDDVFYREEISNDDMMDYLYAFIFDFEYSDFNYYIYRYVAQSASTDSNTFTNVSLFFADGKIIELDATINSQTINVSYNYDDVTVTIPEQYQDVVPSPEPPAPSSAQVNQTQWNAAFAMGEVLTQIQTQTYENGIESITTSKYKENVGMSMVMETKFNNTPVGTSGMYIEIDTVNDKIYMYEPVFSPDYSTILGYSKQETMIDLSEGSVLPPELMDMSKYTFNSTTGAYEAQSITMEIAPGSSVTYTDIAIKFQDGVLLSVTYSGEDGSGTFDTVITISRDDVTITFPEPYEAPSAGMNQTQWAAMFKVAENMTMTQVSTYGDDSTVVLVGKFASNGMMTTITESNYPGEERISYFEFDIANDTVWRYEEGPEGVYTKVAFPFGYTQYMSNVTIETEDLMNLEDFTYNSALGAYVAETIEGEYQTYTNVAIYVTDGKITTVSYDSEDSDGAFSYVMTCTYGDTIVDLPVAQPAE